jgi:hypothetical protein
LLVAKAIKRIATEVAPSFLAAQGTKTSELIKLLSNSGFHFQSHLNYNNNQTLGWLSLEHADQCGAKRLRRRVSHGAHFREPICGGVE